MNLTTTYGIPTENITRKMKYMIGEVWKLSDILRVNGKISQQAIKPTAIMIRSIIITNGAFVHNCDLVLGLHVFWRLKTFIWFGGGHGLTQGLPVYSGVMLTFFIKRVLIACAG